MCRKCESQKGCGCGNQMGCGYAYQNQGYYRPIANCGGMMPMMGVCGEKKESGGICNFSTLVILILVLLQFGKGKKCCDDCCDDDCCGSKPAIDNGILFIIALFYLSCGCK